MILGMIFRCYIYDSVALCDGLGSRCATMGCRAVRRVGVALCDPGIGVPQRRARCPLTGSAMSPHEGFGFPSRRFCFPSPRFGVHLYAAAFFPAEVGVFPCTAVRVPLYEGLDSPVRANGMVGRCRTGPAPQNEHRKTGRHNKTGRRRKTRRRRRGKYAIMWHEEHERQLKNLKRLSRGMRCNAWN